MELKQEFQQRTIQQIEQQRNQAMQDKKDKEAQIRAEIDKLTKQLEVSDQHFNAILAQLNQKLQEASME
jgi:hypothetical protein